MIGSLAGNSVEPIKMGFFQHQPHQYVTDDGELRGATITYFNIAAQRMGYNVEWIGPIPYARFKTNLREQSDLDGSAHFVKVKATQGFMYYADKPYHYAQPVLTIVSSDPLKRIDSIEQIRGKSIWFHPASTPSAFIAKHRKELKFWLVAATNDMWRESLRTLMVGRVDAIHDLNAYSLPFAAAMIGLQNDVRTLALPEPALPVFVTFSKKSSRGLELLKRYNQIQAEMNFTHDDYEKLIMQEFETLH